MKTTKLFQGAVLFLFCAVIQTNVCAQGTAFSYQGRLQSGTNVANGSYDLTFSVWNNSVGPSQVGNTFTNAATTVANGLFTITLDFGSGIFDGNPRWLEIAVRTTGGGAFTTLSPRQPLTPAPYAIYAGGVNAAGISGAIPAGNIAAGTITSTMLAAGAAVANLAANGQSTIPSGGLLLAANPNATNLTAGGYTRFGGPLDLSWQQIIGASSPTARGQHAAVWAGNKMIVWGGSDNTGPFNTGGRYDPSSGTWSPLTTNNAPTARGTHTAVWTGSKMIVWGGDSNAGTLNTGGRYDPTTDDWLPMTTNNAPTARGTHTAVWTGIEMIVWGGRRDFICFNDGGRYSPTTDTWSPMTMSNAPTCRIDHTAIWTGSEMIIWGGNSSPGSYAPLNDGARYNPATDSWSPITMKGPPSARSSHTAVWTGDEMIVWGGVGLNTGGRYNPTNDSWSALSQAGAPSARLYHAAVWTGSEMIVWGGYYANDVVNTGDRYNPVNDSWSALPVSGLPVARYAHSAVWSGTEMIIFGGYGHNGDIIFGDTYSYAPSRVMYLYLRP